jgi:4-hydroxy-tetrahydrodipicolinate reductase
MTVIGILGANGRMGRAIALAAPDLGASLAGGVDMDGAVFG